MNNLPPLHGGYRASKEGARKPITDIPAPPTGRAEPKTVEASFLKNHCDHDAPELQASIVVDLSDAFVILDAVRQLAESRPDRPLLSRLADDIQKGLLS